MANNLASNPWVLDTQGTNILHSSWAWISAIVWSNYTNPSDQCIIQGSYGPNNQPQSELTFTGKGDLSEVKLEPADPIRIRDFTLATLTSGKVQVFVK